MKSDIFSVQLKSGIRDKLNYLANFYGLTPGAYIRMKITEDYRKNKIEKEV